MRHQRSRRLRNAKARSRRPHLRSGDPLRLTAAESGAAAIVFIRGASNKQRRRLLGAMACRRAADRRCARSCRSDTPIESRRHFKIAKSAAAAANVCYRNRRR